MYRFDIGTENDPALNLAFNYLSYLGTPTMTAEEIAQKMYQLACSYGLRSGSSATSITLTGLDENLPEAMKIIEDLAYNAVPDENILANMKADMLKSRADAKLNQSSCFSALQRYVFYGPEFIDRTTLSNDEIMALTSEELLSKVRNLLGCQHEVVYYGPDSESEVVALLKENHVIAEDLKPLEKTYSTYLPTPESKVYMVQYDAKQIYYLQYSNRGERFDMASEPYIDMYNEDFGGGMNAIVFQEMREARGLAYSSQAR